jgi:hypothetical protein
MQGRSRADHAPLTRHRIDKDEVAHFQPTVEQP